MISAVFDGCPLHGKKMATAEGETTHTGYQEWSDCSLKCASLSSCLFWQWNSGSNTCSTMTGNGVYTDDAAFTAGQKGCDIHANITGFVTCSAAQPWSGLPYSKHKQVAFCK